MGLALQGMALLAGRALGASWLPTVVAACAAALGLWLARRAPDRPDPEARGTVLAHARRRPAGGAAAAARVGAGPGRSPARPAVPRRQRRGAAPPLAARGPAHCRDPARLSPARLRASGRGRGPRGRAGRRRPARIGPAAVGRSPRAADGERGSAAVRQRHGGGAGRGAARAPHRSWPLHRPGRGRLQQPPGDRRLRKPDDRRRPGPARGAGDRHRRLARGRPCRSTRQRRAPGARRERGQDHGAPGRVGRPRRRRLARARAPPARRAAPRRSPRSPPRVWSARR